MKETVMKDICKKFTTRQFTERTLRFFLLTLRSAVIKLKMSSDSSFELLMDFLNTLSPDIPDGADLIDAVGGELEKMRFSNILQSAPAIYDMLSWMYDECLCDTGLSVLVHNGMIDLSLKTEGIKEFYEHLMQGFSLPPKK